MDIKKYLKFNGESYIFNGDGEFIFYVPKFYFTKNYAVMKGEYIDIFGLLNYTIRDKSGKNNGLHMMKFPSVFTTKPSDTEKINSVKLTQNTKEMDYVLLKYKKGDEIISHNKIPQVVENCEMFFKMFIYADVPATLNYGEIPSLFNKNMQINGYSYGLNMQLFGLLVAELYRDPTDKSKLLRNSTSKDFNTHYQAITIFDAPKNISAYTAVTSQNWDKAVVSAIMTKNNKYSPLERLFTI